MIKPSFPTLFRSSEDGLVTYKVKLEGDGVPVFFQEFSSKIIFRIT